MGQSRKDIRTIAALPNTNIYTSAVDDDDTEIGIETTDSYVTVLKLDVRGYRKILIEAFNQDASNDIHWRIRASRKHRQAVALTETFWDSASVDFREIKLEEAIVGDGLTFGTDFESDLKLYSFISVQAKAVIGSSQGDALIRATLVP